MKRIYDLLKKKLSKINFIQHFITVIVIMFWVLWILPWILLLLVGIENRPDIQENPHEWLLLRAISMFITKIIIKKHIVPKIMIIIKIFEGKVLEIMHLSKIKIDSLKKSILQHEQILNLVVSCITAKLINLGLFSSYIDDILGI